MRVRKLIQILSAVFFNGYLAGFFHGRPYSGQLKQFCVPVLNCYSCPGALGACPIGAIQAVAGSHKFSFSWYALGTIAFFGVLFGRVICGFLCPFGWIQELLYRIPVPKVQIPAKIDKTLRFLKYLVLLLFVLLLPVVLVDKFGIASPYFCKFICPVGTLEGGIPLLIQNDSLRRAVGILFSWKAAILLAILFLSMIIYRPFCKYICPLGAFYGLFHRISFYQIYAQSNLCIGCAACSRSCRMQVPVHELIKKKGYISSPECIRCGDCKDACTQHILQAGIRKKAQANKI